jgi:predicted N-acetyltransferase YhbS
MVEIREEKPADARAIRSVNEKAFGQPQEASIVPPGLFLLLQVFP